MKSEDGMVGRCGFGDGLLVVRWSFADSLLPMRHKSEGRAKEERPTKAPQQNCGERWLAAHKRRGQAAVIVPNKQA